jgi:2-polyprenyl-6-methoxyphenol hydroxylase-like FAD-dependent oxidoreductase
MPSSAPAERVGMRISVVGAGVAGLTAAVALQRDGHDVRVHEQAS